MLQQNTHKAKTDWFLIGTLGTATLFAFFKIQFLNEPCNGDEAYPYAAAVNHMVQNELGLSPTVLPEELSKGHPLLFHFLQASWIRIFGSEMWIARLFPLLISLTLIYRVYNFGKQFFSAAAGFAAVLLLVSRSIFFIQSTIMLPEVLLAVLLLVSVQFFLQKKWMLYFLCGAMMVLVKEPGLVFIGLLVLFSFFKNIKKKTPLAENFKELVFSATPLLIAAAFFFVQKIQKGWFFYPVHIGYISLDSFFSKLITLYFSSVFVFYGGIFIFTSFILFLLLNKFVRHKGKLTEPEVLMLVLTTGYLLFASLNFGSPRYMFCIYPFFFLLAANQLFRYYEKRMKFSFIIIIILFVINLGYLLDIRKNGDLDLRYRDANKVRSDVVEFCIEQGWQQKRIYAPFFMDKYLSLSSSGYVSEKNIFRNVSNSLEVKPEIFIIPSDELYPTETRAQNLNLKLIRRFELNNYWIEIKTPF